MRRIIITGAILMSTWVIHQALLSMIGSAADAALTSVSLALVLRGRSRAALACLIIGALLCDLTNVVEIPVSTLAALTIITIWLSFHNRMPSLSGIWARLGTFWAAALAWRVLVIGWYTFAWLARVGPQPRIPDATQIIVLVIITSIAWAIIELLGRKKPQRHTVYATPA